MDSDNIIRLSGPFVITDSLGREWRCDGIRIFDEGYSIIDVYVDFAESTEDLALDEDPSVMRQIGARLRDLGYVGPELSHGDPGLQDDRLIVLEAPEAFSSFAAAKGWRNLAEDYAEGGGEVVADADSYAIYAALLARLARS